jgi:hypothetical protein
MNGRDWFIVLARVFALWVLVQAIDGLLNPILNSGVMRGYFSDFVSLSFLENFIHPLFIGAIGWFLLFKTEILAGWIYREPSIPRGFEVKMHPTKVVEKR